MFNHVVYYNYFSTPSAGFLKMAMLSSIMSSTMTTRALSRRAPSSRSCYLQPCHRLRQLEYTLNKFPQACHTVFDQIVEYDYSSTLLIDTFESVTPSLITSSLMTAWARRPVGSLKLVTPSLTTPSTLTARACLRLAASSRLRCL